MSEPARSRHARRLAEAALFRIVDAYGAVPEFVVLGGLVPDLLCGQSSTLHVGRTDVDVQVSLEIAGGSAKRQPPRSRAPVGQVRPRSGAYVALARPRCARAGGQGRVPRRPRPAPNQATVAFDGCEQLGAVNL